MKLSFDKFERYELPQVTLCNPNSRAIEVDEKITITDTVGVLSNPKGMNLKLNFNAPHELSFDYYRHKDTDPARVPVEYIVEILDKNNKVVKQVDTFSSSEEAEKCVDEFDLSTLKDGEYLNIIKQSFYDSIYDAIQTDRYIYLTDIGYFAISSVTDSDEDNIDKKSISLKSCEENEFATAEGLYLEEGTYQLHTEDNKGLLDLFLPKTAGWAIGFIDPALLVKYDSETGEEKAVERYVEKTEVDNGYNFLYTTIQDMFECIVEPDIIKRTISVYSRAYYAEHHLTDIHIAKYNLLKHKTVEENDEDKYTALNVQGKDENLEIRAVNPTGKNVIYNFEPRYSWMSPALQQAIEKWQEKCESVEEEYFNLQKSYYDELDLLFNEEKDIEVKKGELKQLEDTRDAALTMTAGDERDTSVKNCNDAIAIKQTEINTATSNYNSHKFTVQATYEEPISKINTDCTLGTIIENFNMESGTISSSNGQPSKNAKRIRTANYILLDSGTYTILNLQNFPVVLYVYDNNNNWLSNLSITTWSNSPLTFTLDSQYKIKFAIKKSDTDKITISDVSGIKLEKSDGSFATDINGNTIFTTDLLNEMMTHIKPTDYVDEYMLVTESMTYPQRFEKAKELMDRAQSQLVKISSGQKTYSIDTRSFLFNKQFRHFSEQLCAGAIIYVETKNDKMEQLHLTGIDISFDDKSTNFTLGNKYDRSDLKALYDDALGQNSKSFSELKYIASIIEDQQNQLDYQKNWVADLRTLTLDNVLTSEDQAIEINNRGLIGRKRRLDENGEWDFDENGNPYFEDEQVKLINNTLVFTEDNWNTASTAVGKIAVGNGQYAYGINGQVLIGELILGNKLVLTGTSAGIQIKNNDNENVFYADDEGNLVLSGTIKAQDGEIAGWKILPSGLEWKSSVANDKSYYFFGSGGTTNILSFHNETGAIKFRVSKQGLLTAEDVKIKGLTANDAVITGEITAERDDFQITLDGSGLIAYTEDGNNDNPSKIYMYANFIDCYNSSISFYDAVESGTECGRIGESGIYGLSDTDTPLEIDWNGEVRCTTLTAANKVVVENIVDISISASGNKYVKPVTDNTGAVGSPNYKWSAFYAQTGSINTSDKNVKDNISALTDKHKQLFMKLIPVSFTFINGTSGRTHIGFISQDVEQAMYELGMSSLDFAGFCKDIKTKIEVDKNGNEIEVPDLDNNGNEQYLYALRYEEFIGIISYVLQDVVCKIDSIEETLKKLTK